MSVAEGPNPERKKNGKIIKSMATSSSLLIRYREGNSLYSKIVTAMQL